MDKSGEVHHIVEKLRSFLFTKRFWNNGPCVYVHIDNVSGEECINYVDSQGGFTGSAHGLTLLHDLDIECFPIGQYVVSPDQRVALWLDPNGNCRIPCMIRFSDNDRRFTMSYYDFPIGFGYAILFFRKIN